MTDRLPEARAIISELGLSTSSQTECCPACHTNVPVVPGGPTHRYIGASPGCWALYTALLAREFAAFDGRVHQLSVDTYAAQHPGPPSPQAIQSVCTHLVALCLSLEHGFGVEDLRPLMGDLSRGRWFAPRWLEPPTPPWPMTIVALLDADSPGAHGERVRTWVSATWSAWEPHHGQVREWARAVIANRSIG